MIGQRGEGPSALVLARIAEIPAPVVHGYCRVCLHAIQPGAGQDPEAHAEACVWRRAREAAATVEGLRA